MSLKRHTSPKENIISFIKIIWQFEEKDTAEKRHKFERNAFNSLKPNR